MFKIERQLQRLEELLRKPDVKEAMQMRCEETRHDFQNAVSIFPLQAYQICEWCGHKR